MIANKSDVWVSFIENEEGQLEEPAWVRAAYFSTKTLESSLKGLSKTILKGYTEVSRTKNELVIYCPLMKAKFHFQRVTVGNKKGAK